MARTKGSKGKKTLAKEMGMTLEEYNEWVKNNINLNKKERLEKREESKKKNSDSKNAPKVEKSEETKGVKANYLGNDEILKISDLHTEYSDTDEKLEHDIQETIDIQAKEDEKKDKNIFSYYGTKEESPNITIPEKKEKKSIKKSKDIVECSRCHQMILGVAPQRINLTYITTMASYHREVSEDRPLLCHECIKKLNKLIDNFLLDDESGIPRKFKLN